MLIEFRVANHRSIREELVLSMEAGALGTRDDPRLLKVPGAKKPLLAVAAIFGANASGKSNVLSALRFMVRAVLRSAPNWSPRGGIERSPFAWGSSTDEPSLFEVSLIIRGIKYQYGFTLDDREIVEEWLNAWPKGRKQSWFSRQRNKYKFGEHLGGNRNVVRETTRPNALFLSNAAQLQHAQLLPVHQWFSEVLFQSASEDLRESKVPRVDMLRRMLEWEGRTLGRSSLFAGAHDEPESELESFTKLIRAADLGIVDIALERDEPGAAHEGTRRHKANRVFVKHQRESGSGWLPLDQESDGTLAIFCHAPKIHTVLRHGSLLVTDELEASLHPALVRRIAELFNSPETNPHNAQLIFTTHDTSLLGTSVGPSILRRDQTWLTKKDRDGATALTPLTDYRPRKGENLERGFLQGRYGAVPDLGNFPLVAPLLDDGTVEFQS